MSAIIRLDAVSKSYPLGNTYVKAVDEVDLEIDTGEFVVIAGPSGAGKTSMLNIIGCIDVPTDGELYLDGEPTSKLSEGELTQVRLRKIGFIFQAFNLVEVLNVYQNVEFPLLLQGELDAKQRRERVEALVERVGLGSFIEHRPAQLSGGQRQRVAIARALVGRPRLVMADEPTANLDSKTGRTIIDLLREINRTEQTTFVFSSHDAAVIERADRVIRLRDGRIESYGRQTKPNRRNSDGASQPTALSTQAE